MRKQIQIYGVPKFEVPLSLAEARQLQNLSAIHYDSTCRAAGMVGGFIYGWINQLTWGEAESDTVFATWRELDLLQKICEQSTTSEITQLMLELRGAMQYAAKVATTWRAAYHDPK